jgi:hypothetical protein
VQADTVYPSLSWLHRGITEAMTHLMVRRYAPWPPADVGAALHAVDRRILAAPELTAPLLTAVSAMAAGAPSSMLPSAMLRLWTRATALEISGGVHNGARDAALQAAIDLLTAPPPAMCAPGPGASQYELAVGMKESHAWARLKARPSLRCGTSSRVIVVPCWWLLRHNRTSCLMQLLPWSAV